MYSYHRWLLILPMVWSISSCSLLVPADKNDLTPPKIIFKVNYGDGKGFQEVKDTIKISGKEGVRMQCFFEDTGGLAAVEMGISASKGKNVCDANGTQAIKAITPENLPEKFFATFKVTAEGKVISYYSTNQDIDLPLICSMGSTQKGIYFGDLVVDCSARNHGPSSYKNKASKILTVDVAR